MESANCRLPMQCYIQECVGVQWHSQVGRRLATIHISCILLLCFNFAVQSAFCVCYISIGAVSLAYVDTANNAHLPHTSKHRSYLSPPHKKKQQKQVTKNKMKEHRDGIPKKQPNKVGMVPQYPYNVIPISFAFFPTSTHTHTHTHTDQSLPCHTSHIHSQ